MTLSGYLVSAGNPGLNQEFPGGLMLHPCGNLSLSVLRLPQSPPALADSRPLLSSKSLRETCPLVHCPLVILRILTEKHQHEPQITKKKKKNPIPKTGSFNSVKDMDRQHNRALLSAFSLPCKRNPSPGFGVWQFPPTGQQWATLA